MTVMIHPGRVLLADWLDIYRGAPVTLDPVAQADVEIGTAALAAIGGSAEKSPLGGEAGAGSAGDSPPGEALPAAITRLVVALKLASLAQGLAGVRWELVERLSDFLAGDMLPVVANGTTSPLAGLQAALVGTGDMLVAGSRRSSADALDEVGLLPLALTPGEQIAVTSGTQVETAIAMASLFEAERVFQSALVAAALTETALGTAHRVFDPRVFGSGMQCGRSEVAAALPKLTATARTIEQANGAEHSLAGRSLLSVGESGACLDLLRQAGELLARLANTPAESVLVFWQSGDIVEGPTDTASQAVAADLIALAFREISALADRRIARLCGRTESTPIGAGAADLVATFLAEIRERAFPTGFALEASDADNSAPAGIRRLLPMAGTVSLVVLIEFLAAAKSLGPPDGHAIGDRLQPVLELLRARLPADGAQPLSLIDVVTAADLIRSGALAEAPGIALPTVAGPRPT